MPSTALTAYLERAGISKNRYRVFPSRAIDHSLTALSDIPEMLPLGIQTFREVRESGAYYVDKTQFVHRMITQGKCYFLSRPCRFGKSLLTDTLKELFSGTRAVTVTSRKGRPTTGYPTRYTHHSRVHRARRTTPRPDRQAHHSPRGRPRRWCLVAVGDSTGPDGVWTPPQVMSGGATPDVVVIPT